MAALADLGLLRLDERYSLTAKDISVPPRIAAALGARHLHPELWQFEDGCAHRHSVPPFRIWRVAGGRGMIVHTFFGVPMLIDFSVVPENHTDCLARDTLENVYVTSNFAGCDRIHITTNADDFVLLSVTPTGGLKAPFTEIAHDSLLRRYEGLASLRRALQSYAAGGTDRVRSSLFHKPIRWNAVDLDEVWRARERAIQRDLRLAVGDFDRTSRPGFTWQWFLFDLPAPILMTSRYLRGLAGRMTLVLRGDPEALRWFVTRLRYRLRQLFGKS